MVFFCILRLFLAFFGKKIPKKYLTVSQPTTSIIQQVCVRACVRVGRGASRTRVTGWRSNIVLFAEMFKMRPRGRIMVSSSLSRGRRRSRRLSHCRSTMRLLLSTSAIQQPPGGARPQATDSTCFKSSQSLYLWLGVKRAPRRKCEKVPR